MRSTCFPGLLLAALALSSTLLGAQRGRLRVALPAFGAQVVLDTIGDVQVVKAPPGKVFTAATMVMQNFKIPIDVSDSANGMLGAAKLVRSRNLAGQALSRFLECGSNMTGPRADTHRVQMPLLLLMDPGADGSTRLRIALVGSAQDNSGTSNSPVMCGSTGGLEAMLRTAIGKQLLELP